MGSFLFLGCRKKEFDASYFSKQYCNCLEKKHSKEDFFSARVMCDSELLNQNKFFRIWYIETYYGRYTFFLPQGLRDSVVTFNREFYKYLRKNCCNLAIEGCNKSDSFQIKRNLIERGNP